ncbi:hypothetical protein ADL06_16180 [Streptomyces sp. NRRL F-6491]|nr:hypothetical protein ADL06_16180 [Streptomyces sp. NRRL F-6491]KOX36848.1 hypothetical protein ADL08_31475 [Streptomyces sp. NRRL F-6492]
MTPDPRDLTFSAPREARPRRGPRVRPAPHPAPGPLRGLPVRWGPYPTARGTWQTAALTVVSPLVMSGPLIRGSGKRLLEAPMAQRPGPAAHKARASGSSPRPARRHTGGTAAR